MSMFDLTFRITQKNIDCDKNAPSFLSHFGTQSQKAWA